MASTLGNNGAATGWAMPGSAFAFASKYTMPAKGGVVTNISAYFDTFQGNGALGWLCVWDGNTGAIIISVQQGIINNGTEAIGGQAMWSQPVSPGKYIAAGTSLWIGGYCNQNTLFGSTSGSAGQSSYVGMGTNGPGSFTSPTASAVGPAIAFITYTPGGVAHVRRAGVWSAGGVVGARRTSWNINQGASVRRTSNTWNTGS